MNFGPAPSLALASRRGGCGVVEQVGLWVVQTHMSTGPVREGVEVLAGLLAKLESLARTVDKNSEAARDRVDQLDLRQLLEQASVYDDLGVSARPVRRRGLRRSDPTGPTGRRGEGRGRPSRAGAGADRHRLRRPQDTLDRSRAGSVHEGVDGGAEDAVPGPHRGARGDGCRAGE